VANWEVRDVQNIADVLVDPEGALEKRNHWEKTQPWIEPNCVPSICRGIEPSWLAG
jgi:type IV secretion system protein VirD4